ncbi:MAG TPA: LysR family transcriptional regulator [Steroidobacteraceae bacterium]|nr:LysR family transcriptional regulator [Steroidobacteraceae bacterium]
MHLTLRQLLIFTAVVDTGSTTAAGARVALSQSATSAALNELEKVLGAQLFDRVGKRLIINDNGRTLLPQARAAIDVATGIEREFGVGTRNAQGDSTPINLRVAASTTIGNYVLPTLIASFRKTFPHARVDVQIHNTRHASAAVGRFEVDMGLIEGPSHEPDVHAEPWIEDELVILCAPQHPLALEHAAERVKLKALRQAFWLLREAGSGTREAVEQALLPHLHQLREDIRVGSTEAIKQAAAAGLGLTCLSLAAVRDAITLGKLQVLDTTLPRLVRPFYLIYHQQKQLSAGLERFIAHCRSATT